MDRRLLEHYNTELRHLREMAGEFAREYPKIAGRLALDPYGKDICPDPHVERLMEGFAWLAARVHLQLDAEFPRFTQSLLEILFPQFLAPTPSMTIVHFEPDGRDPGTADGFLIPRGTRLRSVLGRGERTACTFQTSQPVRVLPIALDEARYFTRNIAELELPSHLRGKAALRLRFASTAGVPFSEIALDPLTLFLNGSDAIPHFLYEQLIGHAIHLIVQTQHSAEKPVSRGVFSGDIVRRLGFSPEEALLPCPARTFDGYRLLREYFALPQRFLFVELAHFASALCECESTTLDLVILFNAEEPRLENRFDKSAFGLFATPAINLFSQALDRVHVTDRVSELHVPPDRNRPLDYEIFEFERVWGYGPASAEPDVFQPFFYARDRELDQSAFYTVKRVPRMLTKAEDASYKHQRRRPTHAGTEVYLSLVDANNAPTRPNIRQIGIQALCTNRHLPITMAIGAGPTDFSLEISAPVNAVRCLVRPTDPLPSLAEGRFAWRLISHLSLNFLSLASSTGPDPAAPLRELLQLYCSEGEHMAIAMRQIEGLRDLQSRPVLQRIDVPGPVCFARGLEVILNFDEAGFEGAGVFLFGGLLEQVFARYVSINSFTETVVRTQQRGEIMRWRPRTGQKQNL